MGKLAIKRRSSKKPQIGDLNKRISIYKRQIGTPVFDSAVFSQNLQLIKTVWASLNTKSTTLSGVDEFAKVAENNNFTHQFIIRYRTDIVAKNIVTFDSVNYEILKVDNPDLRKEFLFLNCMILGDKTLAVNE